MKKLLISFILISVFSSCGVKKLTPGTGFYISKEKVSFHKLLTDKVEERQSEELIKPSEQLNDIESLPLPQAINDHSVNEESDDSQSESPHNYNEKIPVNGNGLRTQFKHNLDVGLISKITHETQTKRIKKQTQKIAWNSDVDWEMLGLIGFYILLAIVLALAFFGTGPWAAAATIIVAIGYAILLVAAVVCILWFLNFVFFGWLKY